MVSKYRTIVVDPPWAYDEGWPAESTSPNSVINKHRGGIPKDINRRDRLPYPSLSVDDIKALPIQKLVLDDAHLFLWTTNRYITNAYDAVRAWGFKPSQILTWCKPTRGIGPGGLFSITTEHVVYARKGKPPYTERIDSTWWLWSRKGHSVKPEGFLDIVERACPGPYLELFARRNRLGWDTWGNEALQHVDLDLQSAY